jgi:hypothetical protein
MRYSVWDMSRRLQRSAAAHREEREARIDEMIARATRLKRDVHPKAKPATRAAIARKNKTR